MQEFHLNELQYSDDIKGALRLYIYDGAYHHGGIWFQEKPKYPDEEIPKWRAQLHTNVAIEKDQEVRITNCGDLLVFHAKNGKVLYPADPTKFWDECAV